MADTARADEPPKTGAPAAEAAKAPQEELASDPEEDDLDDLDEVLDEFNNTTLDSKAPAPAAPASSEPIASGPGRPGDRSPGALLEAGEDVEFAQELEKQMEQLLGQKDFQKQFEEIMKEMGSIDPATLAAAERGEGAIPPESAAKGEKAEASFQETIKKTMARMQESGDQASASAAAASADENDMLAQMLKEMESGGFGGEGNDEDFSKMLMGMMEQLTNREILYEPMKELNDKFPAWMEKNRDKTGAEDLKRYDEQQTLVKEITERFERTGYSDSNAKDREYIVERMQKMQAAGSPPPDLVGDMNAAQEALSDIDQGCPTQ